MKPRSDRPRSDKPGNDKPGGDRHVEGAEAIPDLPEELGITDVIDVICVGSGPGALAYAIACAELGLEVMVINPADTDVADQMTLDYLRAMVEDLDDSGGNVWGGELDASLPTTRAQPYTPPADRRERLHPFVGHQLRAWSAQCASSVFGFLCTSVSDTVLTGFRTDLGEPIEATVLGHCEFKTSIPAAELNQWLSSRIDECDLDLADDCTLERLIFHDGRVVGAAVRTPSKTASIRAIDGVVFSTPVPGQVEWPIQSEFPCGSAEVALVSRRAGRFGRVELFVNS